MVADNAASVSNSELADTQVMLNVYDLTTANDYTSWLGFGIFHSGIEVHGMEYGFGAHDYPISGVFEVEPKSCPGFIFRCSVPLGYVNMHPSEFRRFIQSLASDYHGNTYHLIAKNCNHFTDDVAWRLTGRHIPGWVNRLARLGGFCSCLLPESLQVTSVKQLSEYHHAYTDQEEVEMESSSCSRESPESEVSDQDKLLPSLAACSSELVFIKEAKGEKMLHA